MDTINWVIWSKRKNITEIDELKHGDSRTESQKRQFVTELVAKCLVSLEKAKYSK